MATDLAPTSDAVQSAALARLHGFLQKAGPMDPELETAVRDTWMTAWQLGARWGIRSLAPLADQQLRTALGLLCELLHDQEGG